MRKGLSILLLVFVFTMGVAIGVDTQSAQAIGGGGFCYWTCGCNGVPIRCCFTPLGVICSPDPNGPVQCPQIADC